MNDFFSPNERVNRCTQERANDKQNGYRLGLVFYKLVGCAELPAATITSASSSLPEAIVHADRALNARSKLPLCVKGRLGALARFIPGDLIIAGEYNADGLEKWSDLMADFSSSKHFTPTARCTVHVSMLPLFY